MKTGALKKSFARNIPHTKARNIFPTKARNISHKSTEGNVKFLNRIVQIARNTYIRIITFASEHQGYVSV